MALVAARLGGDGVARLKALYARAIELGYRFYSFGDAMLVI
jgi:S-adenosylmethionine:tRNA-ribosyltransferase-isomerase (queuine synthetase)